MKIQKKNDGARTLPNFKMVYRDTVKKKKKNGMKLVQEWTGQKSKTRVWNMAFDICRETFGKPFQTKPGQSTLQTTYKTNSRLMKELMQKESTKSLQNTRESDPGVVGLPPCSHGISFMGSDLGHPE